MGEADPAHTRVGPISFGVDWAIYGEINVPAIAAYTVDDTRLYTVPIAPFPTGLVGLLKQGSSDAQLKYRATGLWLRVSAPVQVTEGLGIVAELSYFIPCKGLVGFYGGISEKQTLFATTNTPPWFVTEVAQYGERVQATLSPRTKWFAAELWGYYRVAPGLSAVGGLVYDRLEAVMSPTSPIGVAGREFTPDPVLTAQLNSLVPYFGLSTRIGDSRGGVNITIKGFPAVFYPGEGSAKGYFAELILEYYDRPYDSAFSYSIFAKAKVLHASFANLLDLQELITPGTVQVPGTPSNRPRFSQESALTVTWEQLSIGGSISLSFTSPL